MACVAAAAGVDEDDAEPVSVVVVAVAWAVLPLVEGAEMLPELAEEATATAAACEAMSPGEGWPVLCLRVLLLEGPFWLLLLLRGGGISPLGWLGGSPV